MRAMVLEAPREPLVERRMPIPRLGYGQLLIRVRACGVCRTDLHVLDGELADAKLPLVLGHQIVGTIVAMADGVEGFTEGQRVGVPWLGRACGDCKYCLKDRENLCDRAEFTGYQIDGGYAEYAAADQRFALPLPGSFPDMQAAPLLCAGLIGYRALSMTGDAEHVGLYGFGSAAHIIAQVAIFQGRKVYAFTRPGDTRNQEFAKKLGATWAGSSDAAPPLTLDAAIIFAPAGTLVPRALRAVGKGGSVVCAGIHMSDIPSFPYELLWGERALRSVANLTRRDGVEFLELAPRVPVRSQVQGYPLSDANRALSDLRNGAVSGALVLTI
ncbi:MAG TPA: zinc-dependent alcohol dehydrogenase family protein [Polyangiaceae bacterium]|jgi:propanol-preferring alcohol dehydrogenase|nr:zinc-dependent alcohol dehydrogenase family protein [Polyangiaceae bacterium]